MGGFRLVCTEIERKRTLGIPFEERLTGHLGHWFRSRLGNHTSELMLDFWSFCKLLEKHKIDFPTTTVEEINDQSKGDALLKGIALLQILWFIIQLVACYTQGLAVTELELTTAALAGVNSMMYLFWWDKPLDVRCPIIIHTKSIQKMLAKKLYEPELNVLLGKLAEEMNLQNETFWWPEGLLSEKISLEDKLEKEVRRISAERPAEEHDWLFMDPDHFRVRDYLWFSAAFLFQPCWMIFVRTASRPGPKLADGDMENKHLEQGKLNAGGKGAHAQENWCAVSENNPKLPLNVELRSDAMSSTRHNKAMCCHLKQHFKRIIVATRNTIKKLLLLPRILVFMPMESILRPIVIQFSAEQYSDAREKIHSKSGLKLLFDNNNMHWIMLMIFYCEEANAKPLIYFSAIAGATFGSIHCAAWNSTFLSLAEKIMWCTASLALVSVCLSIIPGTLIQRIAKQCWNKSQNGSLQERACAIFGFGRNLSFAPTIIYSIARLTLLVLALLSLRGLTDTDSTLRTIEWTAFIPHI